MAKVAPTSRLLAIGLLNYADDQGFFWASEPVIRGALFPFEPDASGVRQGLTELAGIGYIKLGDFGGKRVGRVVNFLPHQIVNRPQPSNLSGLPVTWDQISERSVNDHGAISERSVNDHGAISERSVNDHGAISDGSGREWKGRGMEGNGNARVTAATFSPGDEHAQIAAIRHLDLERQAARFRESNGAALDAPQNWHRRFSAWLAQARPENVSLPHLVANAPYPETPQPLRAPRPEPRWALERDLREAKAELAKADEEYKEARSQRNRFTGGDDHHKYQLQMNTHQADMEEAKARITDLKKRLETAV